MISSADAKIYISLFFSCLYARSTCFFSAPAVALLLQELCRIISKALILWQH